MARETAESQLASAQAQVITLEQRVSELQSQLSTASKPKVGYRILILPHISPLIYILQSSVIEEDTTLST